MGLYKESLKLMFKYNSKVKSFDPTNPAEVGSLPGQWPFMGKAIPAYFTINKKWVKYVYFFGNPFVWYFSLLGVLLSFSLLISSLLQNKRFSFNLGHTYIFCIYLLSFLPYFFVSRVLYIYHYYISLCIGLVLGGLILDQHIKPIFLSTQIFRKNKQLLTKTIFALCIAGCISTFNYYKFMTYYEKVPNNRMKKIYTKYIWNLK